MAAPKLHIKVKRFIVRSLACYDSPTEVAATVKEMFDVEISKQGVAFYDPTTAAGKELSKTLTELFYESRKEFEETEDLPIAKKVFRLRKLAIYVETFEKMKNYKAAAGILEQAAKEIGGMFTNRKEITGANGGAIAVHAKTLDDWEKDAESRTAEAAAALEMLETDED